MKITVLLSCMALTGCIDNTKLENNTLLDSGENFDASSITPSTDSNMRVLLSVDTTFGQVSQINPTNGYTIPIVPVPLDYQISSMAFNEYSVAYVYDHIQRKIGTFDPCSGELNLLPVANEDNVICGLSFTPNGLLYGLDSKNNALVTYDLETGEASSVGSLNMNIRACGLAYDSASEHLIGATASTGEIFHIDIETGNTFNHFPTNVPFEGVGVEYDTETESLLVSTGSDLYTVDPTDGSSMFLGVMDGHIDDLVFHSECQ